MASLAGENYKLFAEFNNKKCIKNNHANKENFALHFLVSRWDYFMPYFHCFLDKFHMTWPESKKDFEIHPGSSCQLPYTFRMYLRIAEFLHNILQEYLPNEDSYREMLFFHEYLMGTMFYDDESVSGCQKGEPFTTFLDSIFLDSIDHTKKPVIDAVRKDIDRDIDLYHENWEILKSGLFQGSLTRFQEAQTKLHNKCQNSSRGF